MTSIRNDTCSRGLLRRALAGFLALAAACGGTAPDAEEAASGGPSHAERATAALERGDLDEAGREAEAAVRLSPSDPETLRIGAQVAIARGEAEPTIALLEGAEDPVLLRLRARAHAALGDLEAIALDLAPADGRPPADGWAAVMLPIARSLPAGARAWVVEGGPEVELPFAADVPLPLVHVEIDAHRVLALVATSADISVVDESLRARPGLAENVRLGRFTLGNVPVIPRDLGPVRDELGVDVRAVIGVDVLLRLCATLDFRGRRLILRQTCAPPGSDAAEVPYATLGGSFLVVPMTLDGRVSGWWTLDSAGAFPLALADATVAELGRDLATLPPAPGAPNDSIRILEVDVRIGRVAIDGVPGGTGLVPADLGELAGTRIAGIVGAGLLQPFAVTIDPRRRRVVLE